VGEDAAMKRRWNYNYRTVLVPPDFGSVSERCHEAVRLARQRCQKDPDEADTIRVGPGDICVVRFKRRSIWSY
jgi:hypothetical protein